jgi:hypothetical protein
MSTFFALSVSEEEREFERLRQADDLKLARGREGFRDVAAIEGSPEALSPGKSRTDVRIRQRVPGFHGFRRGHQPGTSRR